MTTSSNINSDTNWSIIIDNFTKSFEGRFNKYKKINVNELRKYEKEYTFSNLVNTESFGSFFCRKCNLIDFKLMHPLNMTYEEQIAYIIKNYTKCP
jgi:hypothetical protein